MRFAGLCAVVCAALVVTALPASAGCEDSIPGCGLDHDDTTATPLHVQQIATTIPLRTDNEGLSFQVYASLVPAQYDIPSTPLIGVSFADIQVPTGNGAAQESWLESTIAIRVANDGVDGWYPLSRATTTPESYQSGRDLGWPTYTATGALEATDSGWAGQMSVDDTQALSLEWLPDESDLSEVVDDWTRQRDAFYSLTPVFSGPTRMRVQNSAKPVVPVFDPVGGAPEGAGTPFVTEFPPVQSGPVHVVLNPNLNDLDSASAEQLPNLPFSEGRTLAEVIELDQTVPGSFWETDQLRFTQTDDLDDGQDGPVPSTPTVGATWRQFAPPNATLTGFVSPVIALPQGSSIDFTNADTGVHDFTSVEYDPVTYKARFHAAAAPTETKHVEGVEVLPPGQYDFVCTIHRGQMTGTLFIF